MIKETTTKTCKLPHTDLIPAVVNVSSEICHTSNCSLIDYFFFDMTVDFKAKMAIKQSEDTGKSDPAG